MLQTTISERDYLIDDLSDVDYLVDELSFNVQDAHWLVYCAMSHHEHLDLPEVDERTGQVTPQIYSQVA